MENRIFTIHALTCEVGMKMLVYSAFDKKAKDHQGLTLAPNDEVAVRWFKEGVPGSGTPMEKYPEDFQLRCVGEFDTTAGDLIGEGSRLVVELEALLQAGPHKGLS